MPTYVGSTADRVLVYDDLADGNAPPIGIIEGPSTGLSGVADIAFDSAGNLYVANLASGFVNVYARGALGDIPPIRRLRVGGVVRLAFDTESNLYALIGNGFAAEVRVFAPGADGDAGPIRTITGIGSDHATASGTGLALSSTDTTFVCLGDDRVIQAFLPGWDGPAAPIGVVPLGVSYPAGIAFDTSDRLYLANGGNVRSFPPGGVSPDRTFSVTPAAVDVAVDATGLVYVGNVATPPDGTVQAIVAVYAADADGDVPPIRAISGPDTGLSIYTSGIAIGPPLVPSQNNWRWCNKCQGLFYAGDTTTGACPSGGGHNYAGSGDYTLSFMPAPGQDNWRRCTKCEGLFYAGSPTPGLCPSGGGHDAAPEDYALPLAPGAGQEDWRWCYRCQGLFFAGNTTTGWCPAGGGHDYGESGDYVLAL